MNGVDRKRRDLLRMSLFAPLAAGSIGLPGCSGGSSSPVSVPPSPQPPPPVDFSPLQAADSNGVRLPAGFTSRVVARTGEEPLTGSGYPWHSSPDGGATFAVPAGGWVYVSNSEESTGLGGVGAIRFSATGEIVAAYSILQQTTRNCAGGPTPWSTWLSCEEIQFGYVWECDPFGMESPRRLDSLGRFPHEAAAIDPATQIVYMTEDVPDGRFYRFIPNAPVPGGRPDLSNGLLQAAEIETEQGGVVNWHDISDPSAATNATRRQAPNSTAFNRGEGIWYDNGRVYFSTTGDNRIWQLDLTTDVVSIIYDASDHADPVLRGVDNITVSPRGDVLVAEDGDDLQLVMLSVTGDIQPILQLVGHDESEITGPAFDPSGSRLYFSSQDGTIGTGSGGITYEITGAFPW